MKTFYAFSLVQSTFVQFKRVPELHLMAWNDYRQKIANFNKIKVTNPFQTLYTRRPSSEAQTTAVVRMNLI